MWHCTFSIIFNTLLCFYIYYNIMKKTKILSITEYYCIGNKPGNILLLSGKGCIHIILHENVIKYKNEKSNLLK